MVCRVVLVVLWEQFVKLVQCESVGSGCEVLKGNHEGVVCGSVTRES